MAYKAFVSSTFEDLKEHRKWVKADGSVVRCSRSENKELFSLALGGYGLFGVILDDLRVVPNERLRLEQYIVPLDQAMGSFERKLRAPPIGSGSGAETGLLIQTSLGRAGGLGALRTKRSG